MSENILPLLAPKERCTGCGACASGCPKGAIHLLPDREGFLTPAVTDACIQCAHCTHVCPVLRQREKRSAPAAFAAWNPDPEIRMASSAGGVFFLLADYVLETGGVVFGAATDSELRVRHMAAHNAAELKPLLGAKPVQSELGDTFPRIRRYLDAGRRVLFCGTPCQVDGLYHYLGEHPDNLLTADLLCQGVCSPGVWEQLVRSMAYVKRRQPVSVTFFGKLAGEKRQRFRVQFEDNSVFDAPFDKCELGRGHRRGLLFRPACHTCPYTSTDRVGDLSLGVCEGLPKDFYPDEQKNGVSLLLVNSAKGARTLDVLPLKKEPLSLESAVAAAPALRESVPAPAERSDFFAAFAQQPFHQVQSRFLAPLAYQARRRGDGLLRFLHKNEKREKRSLWKKR